MCKGLLLANGTPYMCSDAFETIFRQLHENQRKCCVSYDNRVFVSPTLIKSVGSPLCRTREIQMCHPIHGIDFTVRLGKGSLVYCNSTSCFDRTTCSNYCVLNKRKQILQHGNLLTKGLNIIPL